MPDEPTKKMTRSTPSAWNFWAASASCSLPTEPGPPVWISDAMLSPLSVRICLNASAAAS